MPFDQSIDWKHLRTFWECITRMLSNSFIVKASVDALILFDWFPISRRTFGFVFEIVSIVLATLSGTFLWAISMLFRFEYNSRRKCWTSTRSWILLSLRYVLSHVCIFWRWNKKNEFDMTKKVQISDFIWISLISTNSITRVASEVAVSMNGAHFFSSFLSL